MNKPNVCSNNSSKSGKRERRSDESEWKKSHVVTSQLRLNRLDMRLALMCVFNPYFGSQTHYIRLGGLKNTNIFIVFKLNGTWKIFFGDMLRVSVWVCMCSCVCFFFGSFGAHLLAVCNETTLVLK